ncbi:unnamed protein product [Schistosoma rodhaini]|nr:unnamed protein product [Schistosoma rodhaini]
MPIKRSSGRLGPIGGGVNNNTRRACEQVVSSVPLVKHCTFPVVPKLSRTSFLFLSLMLCLTSTLTQHMNLYRTVWWLPNSSIEYPVEFDSVDYFVTAHIIFMLCTPYVYLIVLKLIPSFIMTSLIMRSVLGLLIFTSWGYIMIWILNRIEYSGTTILYHLSGIVLLAYFPILTLLVCHSRYLEKVVCQDIRHHHPDSTDSSNSRMVYQPSIFSLTNCLQNEHLYIDYWWCLQHCFLTGLVVFLLRWHYFLPCDYIDLLHRISMHLGSWENSLTRSGYLNAISWSASTIYPCGVVVKHMQGLFRSVGINNCAEPGNRLHSRFYFIFDNPKYISSMLLCLSSFSVLYQCFCSYWVCEWYKLIGLIIDALFCFLNLYLHSRNSILVHFVYSQEKGWSLSNYLGISSLRLFSSSSSSTTSISN